MNKTREKNLTYYYLYSIITAVPNIFIMKKSLTPLGETEMEILHHVWDHGKVTVAEVHEKILADRKVAYTTVMTVMKNLAQKGYLSYEKHGMAYVYFPAVPPDTVKESLVGNLVRKVFDGSPAALVQTLVSSEQITDEEREELLRLIREMKQ
jgi:BlaI family transcriptional regulator, penicillinase repressor